MKLYSKGYFLGSFISHTFSFSSFAGVFVESLKILLNNHLNGLGQISSIFVCVTTELIFKVQANIFFFLTISFMATSIHEISIK